MSARKLRTFVLGCSLWFIIYAVAYILFNQSKPSHNHILKDLIPIALALPVAVLAWAFRRRNSYLQALRDLWQHLIPAVQSAIQYTHLQSPEQRDFAETQKAIATAIDMLRGVFRNIPTKDPVGLYPFENLKDISKIVDWLKYDSKFRSSEAERARECIIRLWQEMHSAMLREFDRSVPSRPVSKYLGDGRSVADLLIDGCLADNDLDRPASQPRCSRPPTRRRLF